MNITNGLLEKAHWLLDDVLNRSGKGRLDYVLLIWAADDGSSPAGICSTGADKQKALRSLRWQAQQLERELAAEEARA